MGVLESGNYLYLNVSCGKLVNKHKNISTFGYEGKFIKIESVDDEFEGKPITKVKLHLEDTKSDETAIISFTKESWYSIGFFSKILKINLDKPFTIGTSQSEQNEKISFCWLKQTGIVKVEKDPAFPQPKKITVSKKEFLDWEESLNEMDRIIKQLNSIERTAPVKEEQAEKEENTVSPPPEPDDLPF